MPSSLKRFSLRGKPPGQTVRRLRKGTRLKTRRAEEIEQRHGGRSLASAVVPVRRERGEGTARLFLAGRATPPAKQRGAEEDAG